MSSRPSGVIDEMHTWTPCGTVLAQLCTLPISSGITVGTSANATVRLITAYVFSGMSWIS